MALLVIGLGGGACLALGYFFYGKYVAGVFGLDPARTTPAVELNDGNDYVPTKPIILLGQHFAAIAAVGPIAGPIMASEKFGWMLSFWWIVLGAVFIGAVHDFAAVFASVRHKARSIAEVVGAHISPFAKKIFLIYIWVSLLYIILVFTDLTAAAFISKPELGAQNFGPGVAASSILYLGLAVVMGIIMRRTRIPLTLSTTAGVLLLLFFIKWGQATPIELPAKAWQFGILIYCYAASIIPMWILLQPRGYLGGFLLYASLIAGVMGFLFYRPGEHLGFFPFLFTTIACGACSGFHGLVSSGTTSKQITREPDARVVGYGGMLLESFVALVALGTFIAMAGQNASGGLAGAPASGGPALPPNAASGGLSPDEIYARGLASFLTVAGIPMALGVSFGKLAFATFIYDTLDVTTRLGRYIFQELTGLWSEKSKYLGAFLTLLAPALILLSAKPEAPPAWKAYWGLFGASNQLLACLTLAAVTVWLKKESRNWLVTGIPCLFMAVVTISSLTMISMQWVSKSRFPSMVEGTGLLLLALAATFLYQAGMAFRAKC